jgi:outer membrane murein-binding lipoprotein Lpp
MSYTITKTDGMALTTTNMPGGTLLDGTIDNSIGVTLIGRNYPNYGDAQNENFVRLTENFADNVPPTESLGALNVLVGTIWYDTNLKKIRVFDGTNWNPASTTIVSNTAPTTTNYTLSIGDQWWNTVNNQLNGWNGSIWKLIGPDTAGMALLEAEIQSNVAAINANIGQLRIDTGTYMTANVATLNATIGQLRIDTGTYMTANVTTLNTTIGRLRIDTGTYMTANVATLNATIGQLRIDTGTYMTANVATLNASIFGVQNGITTNVATLNSTISTLSTTVGQLRIDTGTYMTANVATLNATILSVQNGINSNVTALTTNTISGFTLANANAATQQTSINSINSTLLTLAPLASPALTGTPTATTASPNNNSTRIATTAYVDASAVVLASDYNSKFTAEVTNRNTAINNATSTLAPRANPTFTGAPSAPTPTFGDNTTKLATTAFVQSAAAAAGIHYTVSSSGPSGGNDGDFWFQVG